MVFKRICHWVLIALFAIFDILFACDPLQEVAIFVHIEGKRVVRNGLDLADGRGSFLEINLELALHLSCVDFAEIGRILCFIKCYELEVVLALEVFFEAIFHFHAPEQELDTWSLFLQVKLTEFISIGWTESLSEV